ncbi:Glycerol uptake facilitator permease (Major Intrinsic Protein Family) [Lactobacillus delbrueckii subsp. bulgaricus ND02] [Lactiplantibacillus mudanjiangensis]|uniref:MIP/aquaporin family protein n=1 Tax=Lactiplantibacillus mudanjiangensis TaxID=1296538 RepID=UPI001014FBFB|nr:Glycerol uptake facilitator permease (Major Intrinsic Protein Family) [Lactobacillus delbrueckii subsp. bulgaricus ND02] [Lactiplantibacillus mudanjiangensis]
MNGFLGELFGTMILIIIGVGCGATINLNQSYGKTHDWFYVSVAWGLAVTFGVCVAGQFGADGHLNPAVTLSFALFGLFPWSAVGPYLLGQFVGAFIGAAIVLLHYYPHFKATETAAEGNSVGIFATMPSIDNPIFNVLSEIIATFTFIFILLNLGNFTQGLKPLIVGALITTIGLTLGGTTGFALNPARDWGPRLAYTLLPVPHKDSAHWHYAWVPMIGPLVGGVLAAALQVSLH